MISQSFVPDMPLGEYISDPCPEPSLSTSVVDALINRSPLHAWSEHPRLGGKRNDGSNRADIGSAVHAKVFGGATIVYLAPEFEDFRKKEAQAFRDDARASGLIPLLDKQREIVERVSENGARALATLGVGTPEVSMFWQAGGVWCRGRADWLSADGRFDVDGKTVDSADPWKFIKSNVYANCYDTQAGLRRVGHEVLGGRPREMLWLLMEIEAPFATSFVGVGEAMLDLAKRKVDRAAKIWRKCLDDKVWPGYPQEIHWADPAAYAEMEFEFRTGELTP